MSHRRYHPAQNKIHAPHPWPTVLWFSPCLPLWLTAIHFPFLSTSQQPTTKVNNRLRYRHLPFPLSARFSPVSWPSELSSFEFQLRYLPRPPDIYCFLLRYTDPYRKSSHLNWGFLLTPWCRGMSAPERQGPWLWFPYLTEPSTKEVPSQHVLKEKGNKRGCLERFASLIWQLFRTLQPWPMILFSFLQT
jgi:hypothetical protein